MGGQTALNLAIALDDAGVLDECGVEMIGAKREAIKVAEDRMLFKAGDGRDRSAMSPRRVCQSGRTPRRSCWTDRLIPAIIRPSFTLGGTAAVPHITRRV